MAPTVLTRPNTVPAAGPRDVRDRAPLRDQAPVAEELAGQQHRHDPSAIGHADADDYEHGREELAGEGYRAAGQPPPARGADEHVVQHASDRAAEGAAPQRQAGEGPHLGGTEPLAFHQELRHPEDVKLVRKRAGKGVEQQRAHGPGVGAGQAGSRHSSGCCGRVAFLDGAPFGLVRPGVFARTIAEQQPEAQAQQQPGPTQCQKRLPPGELQQSHQHRRDQQRGAGPARPPG